MNPYNIGYDEIDALAQQVDEISGAGGPMKARMFTDVGQIARLAPLGFGAEQSIAAGAEFSFTATPQRSCKLVQLVIDSDKALRLLTVTKLRIGDSDQLLTGEVSAQLYGASAQEGSLLDNFDALQGGKTLTVTVRNDDATPSAVRVAGKAICNR